MYSVLPLTVMHIHDYLYRMAHANILAPPRDTIQQMYSNISVHSNRSYYDSSICQNQNELCTTDYINHNMTLPINKYLL